MQTKISALTRIPVLAAVAACTIPMVLAQPPQTQAQIAEARKTTEDELEKEAIVERKVMVPMRDGKRMAADIYRPKDTSKKYPIIFVRTPYNFNFWDVQIGAPRDMKSPTRSREARLCVRGDERARATSFPKATTTFWVRRLTDGYDAITWMSSQPWSNGKVGTIGCSSTAEWQLGVAAQGNPAFAAMIPQGLRRGRGTRGSVL